MREFRVFLRMLARGGRQRIVFVRNHKLHIIVTVAAVYDLSMFMAGGYGLIGIPQDVIPRGFVLEGLRFLGVAVNFLVVVAYWVFIAEKRRWRRAVASKTTPLHPADRNAGAQQEAISMEARQCHGVVIVWQSTESTLVHRPDYAHGLDAMRSGQWELFPNLQTAVEARNQVCLNCFGNEAPQ